jgi:hypothetical protein
MAPEFQPWVTRIDPNRGRNRVITVSLFEPSQAGGISIIGSSKWAGWAEPDTRNP